MFYIVFCFVWSLHWRRDSWFSVIVNPYFVVSVRGVGSSGCLGKAALFYRGTPKAFYVTILEGILITRSVTCHAVQTYFGYDGMIGWFRNMQRHLTETN